MTHTLEAGPDLAAVKQRQQQAWASGDYHAVAARIAVVAERLVDAADRHAGWRVLDVATGSGNAAIAAARLGCTAAGDYVRAARGGDPSRCPPVDEAEASLAATCSRSGAQGGKLATAPRRRPLAALRGC